MVSSAVAEPICQPHSGIKLALLSAVEPQPAAAALACSLAQHPAFLVAGTMANCAPRVARQVLDSKSPRPWRTRIVQVIRIAVETF